MKKNLSMNNQVITDHYRKIEDDYILGDKIGEPGQYGFALKATHKVTNENVAIKVIRKTKDIPNENYDYLRREIALIKTLDHPNIIKGYGSYEDKKYLYIPMELASGGELFERIKSLTRFNENDAKDILKQILEAISYLHDNNIAHCDLKPDNILFEHNQSKKLKLLILVYHKYLNYINMNVKLLVLYFI